MLNLGLSGVPIAGGDVGGFATGPIPDGTTAPSSVADGRVVGGITNDELFVRWMQVGSFLPWYRNHYIGYDKEFQEAYAYGEPVTSICRKYVELRYRMLQIYYDAMFEWTETGMPIARALFLNDPDDAAVYDHLDDQFFVGRDLLVAPILFPAGGAPAARDVYLPAGSDWYAFRDHRDELDPPIGRRPDDPSGRRRPRRDADLRACRRHPADALDGRTVCRRAAAQSARNMDLSCVYRRKLNGRYDRS